jgi:hypothetical protein
MFQDLLNTRVRLSKRSISRMTDRLGGTLWTGLPSRCMTLLPGERCVTSTSLTGTQTIMSTVGGVTSEDSFNFLVENAVKNTTL